MIKNNYEIIKAIVERNSNNKDLSVVGKYDGLCSYRFVYYKICADYLKDDYNHTRASKAIKRGHNNSIYALKKFDELKDQLYFHSYLKLYNKCLYELIIIEKKINLIFI